MPDHPAPVGDGFLSSRRGEEKNFVFGFLC